MATMSLLGPFALFVASLGLGALSGSGVPLPLDPALSAIAPEECLWYVASAGLAPADQGSSNQTERLLAEPQVKQFHERMGNPNTPEGKQLLIDRSPLYRASAIERPLLIGQGANDPRVKQAESDQIVGAMQKDGIPVTYVVFPDEGHGFAKPTNNIAFNAVTENFLATCLGGRAEPITGELEASTAEIRAGAEYVKGLAAGG